VIKSVEPSSSLKKVLGVLSKRRSLREVEHPHSNDSNSELLEPFDVPAARGTRSCDAEYAARKILGLVSESLKASGCAALPESTKSVGLSKYLDPLYI
jgi:hypothetical protein